MTLPFVQFGFACTLRVLTLLALFSIVSQSALAATEVEPDVAPTTEQSEEEQLRPNIDLGRFQIRELHPVEGVTTNITLTLQLALNREVGEEAVDSLQHWHHRLRNQVIIAIRTADTANFAEPGLKRIRRLILLRVNRMFKRSLAEEVFFNEFTFTVH